MDHFKAGQRLGLTIMFSSHTNSERQALLREPAAERSDAGRWWRPKGWSSSSSPGRGGTTMHLTADAGRGGAEPRVEDAKARLARSGSFDSQSRLSVCLPVGLGMHGSQAAVRPRGPLGGDEQSAESCAAGARKWMARGKTLIHSIEMGGLASTEAKQGTGAPV
jgi:hypothetical protein